MNDFNVYHFYDSTTPVPISFHSKELEKKWNAFCSNGMIGRSTTDLPFPQFEDYEQFLVSNKMIQPSDKDVYGQ